MLVLTLGLLASFLFIYLFSHLISIFLKSVPLCMARCWTLYRVAETSCKREAGKMSGEESMVGRIATGAHVACFLSRLVRDRMI